MELKDFISKLSSYNLFTNLLPGILFVFIVTEFTSFNLFFEPVYFGIFLYYFIGVALNRVGSLVIEPILIYFKFIKRIDYPKFVKAGKMDKKINILLGENNVYRSLAALFLSLLATMGYEWLTVKVLFIDTHGNIIIVVLLFVIFLFAYRKQTKYIVERCEDNLNEQ